MMSNTKTPPNLYIIAGPNGAGKTTFAREFLPNYAKTLEFINADLIAGGLSPFVPERAAIQAGRIMLEQIQTLSSQRKDFGFETTLSGKGYVSLFKDLKKKGYEIHLFFLWIPDPELAIERIANRVRRGGHKIPDDVVRRRFERGLKNLFQLYRPLVDSWAIFDNSQNIPRLIAFKDSGKLMLIDRISYAELLKRGKYEKE
jgi:predicted ABC-type ATPase